MGTVSVDFVSSKNVILYVSKNFIVTKKYRHEMDASPLAAKHEV